MSRDDDRYSRRERSSRDSDRGDRGRDREDDRRERSRDRDGDDDRGRDRGSRGRDSGRRGGSRFEYQQRDSEKTMRRAEQGGKDFDKFLKDSIPMYKPQDNENRIRILPPTWKDADHYGLEIFMHYGVGPDRQSYLCLNKMKGEADPIAEEYADARRDGDDEYAKSLEAKKRVLVYLIDRNDEKKGVQAWAMPWTVDRDIVKVSQDRTTREVLPIDHPEDGYDIIFDKKGKGDRTEYLAVQVARRDSPLGKDEWLDFAMDNPLPEQLLYYDYDHIAKVFGGGGAHRSSRDRDSGRDRDEDRGGRDQDRDNDRGRDREDGRRERSRDRDEDRGGRDRERESRREPELNWDTIHDMTGDELEDLVDQHSLNINPQEAKDDADLADWICEEMNITKGGGGRERRQVKKEDDGDRGESAADRLRRQRRE